MAHCSELAKVTADSLPDQAAEDIIVALDGVQADAQRLRAHLAAVRQP